MLALEGPQELIHLQPSCHWCSSPSKQKKKSNNLITYHLCCNQSVPAGKQRTGHDLLCNIIRSSSRNNGYYLKIKMKLGTQKQSRTNMTCKMSSNRSDLTLWAAHYSGHAAALVSSTPTSNPRYSQILCWSSHRTQRHECLFWDGHRQISDSVMFCLSDCMPACTWTPGCSELPLSIISDLDCTRNLKDSQSWWDLIISYILYFDQCTLMTALFGNNVMHRQHLNGGEDCEGIGFCNPQPTPLFWTFHKPGKWYSAFIVPMSPMTKRPMTYNSTKRAILSILIVISCQVKVSSKHAVLWVSFKIVIKP